MAQLAGWEDFDFSSESEESEIEQPPLAIRLPNIRVAAQRYQDDLIQKYGEQLEKTFQYVPPMLWFRTYTSGVHQYSTSQFHSNNLAMKAIPQERLLKITGIREASVEFRVDLHGEHLIQPRNLEHHNLLVTRLTVEMGNQTETLETSFAHRQDFVNLRRIELIRIQDAARAVVAEWVMRIIAGIEMMPKWYTCEESENSFQQKITVEIPSRKRQRTE